MRALVAMTVVFSVACGDDDGGTDASVDGGRDATVDAPTTDTPMADVPTDAPSGTASIQLFDFDGTPAVGVSYVFHGSEGNVLEVVVSDGFGTATGPMEDGGFISMGGLGANTLTTIGGVRVGDAIVLPLQVPGLASLGNTIVSIAAHGEATSYTHGNGVGSNDLSPGAPTTTSFDARAVADDGFIDVLGLALDAAGSAVAYALVQDFAFIEGDNAITLPDWQSDFDAFTVELSGIEGVTEVAVHMRLFDENRTYTGLSANASLTDGAGSASFVLPPGFGDQTEVTMEYTAGDTFRFLRWRQDGRDAPAITSADLVPAATSVVLEAGASPARPIIRWSSSGEASRIDLIKVGLGTVDWQLILPPDTTELTLPELPDIQRAYRPDASATVSFVTTLDHSDHDWNSVRLRGGLEDNADAGPEFRYQTATTLP